MKKVLANQDLRTEMKKQCVALWKIAELQGVCEMTLTRRWRHELAATEKEAVCAIIQGLARREEFK